MSDVDPGVTACDVVGMAIDEEFASALALHHRDVTINAQAENSGRGSLMLQRSARDVPQLALLRADLAGGRDHREVVGIDLGEPCHVAGA
jgi:hypothetical protein